MEADFLSPNLVRMRRSLLPVNVYTWSAPVPRANVVVIQPLKILELEPDQADVISMRLKAEKLLASE